MVETIWIPTGTMEAISLSKSPDFATVPTTVGWQAMGDPWHTSATWLVANTWLAAVTSQRTSYIIEIKKVKTLTKISKTSVAKLSRLPNAWEIKLRYYESVAKPGGTGDEIPASSSASASPFAQIISSWFYHNSRFYHKLIEEPSTNGSIPSVMWCKMNITLAHYN